MSEPVATGIGGKERLLTAAGELFAFAGYEEVGVAAILLSAGVQAPTLYYHFGEKEGLYVSWAAGALAELGATLRDLALRYPNFREGLVAISATIGAFEGADLIQLMRDSQKLKRDENRERILSAYMESVHEPVCAVLLKGMDSGQLAHEPLGRMASAFVLGSLGSRSGLPSASPSSDATWWPERFLSGFGA